MDWKSAASIGPAAASNSRRASWVLPDPAGPLMGKCRRLLAVSGPSETTWAGILAAGITAISAAPDESVHSNAVFPGVFNGVLEKFSFANLIALVRSTVGLGRQINPTGSTENIGKLPVLRADGEDFHYQLENPATLPSVASNAPTNPDLMNAAIIYKDTAEGETANELYYKRKHDRESVIITLRPETLATSGLALASRRRW